MAKEHANRTSRSTIMCRTSGNRGDLLGSLPLSDCARVDIAHRMAAPTRFYHTMAHLDLLWGRHLRYGPSTLVSNQRHSCLIGFAIAYHDVVFVSGAKDNEARSAAHWLETSQTATSLDVIDRLWVAETIRATADHIGMASSLDDSANLQKSARQWVLDLDLTPLGEQPDAFDRNMDLLDAEMPLLSNAKKKAALIEALHRFSKAKPLYQSRPLADIFEMAAKQNFARHLHAVSAPNELT